MKSKKRPTSRSVDSNTLSTAAKEFAHMIAASLTKRWQTEQKLQQNKNQSSQS